MNAPHEEVAAAFRVLNKCSAGLHSAGPWRWQCLVQNGSRLPLTASLEEGFLQLAGCPEAHRRPVRALENALRGNATLAGGVKFALDAASRGLHLRTDIVLLDEKQLLDRVRWALDGFHQGYNRLKSLDSGGQGAEARAAGPSAVRLGELLRESGWSCTERGANEFCADLSADPAPPARITAHDEGVVLSVDLVRCLPSAEAARKALSIFLLTASYSLRLACACAGEEEGQPRFGFQVRLPAAPAAEEIDHALAALSTACRMCAREANVLLDESAARCYLAVRNVPLTHNSENAKEI